jgi:hypothetical protein
VSIHNPGETTQQFLKLSTKGNPTREMKTPKRLTPSKHARAVLTRRMTGVVASNRMPQLGVYAPSVQKLSLTYYTHNDSGATIPELSGEKSYVLHLITSQWFIRRFRAAGQAAS